MIAICAAFGCMAQRPPTLAAAIMVKNEADAIRMSLESLVNARVSRVILYDTGSTDGTQQVARDDTARLGLELDLFEGPFVDFSVSRNTMLERAYEASDWLLLLDAGDIVLPDGADIAAVLENDREHCAFFIEQRWDNGPRHFVNRLIRNDGRWSYKQPVHEYIEHDDDCPIGTSTLRLWQNRSVSGRTSFARWYKDIEILKRDSAVNPRSAYYLANTYSQLALWNEAIDAYVHRINMKPSGWYEEVEMSHVSLVHACLAVGDIPQADSWAMKLLQTHKRIEGVMALARHALDTQNGAGLCVHYTTLACFVPAITRQLFLDPLEYTLYRYTLRDLCVQKSAQP
jgi:glycosyltransferase involved in cell wall biosynthesis